jgi:nucleotide-binding universal stress UspA family protein
MEFKRIVCALALSEHSILVANYAVTFAKLTGAEVTVVYAAPTLTQYTGFDVSSNTIDAFAGEIVSGAQSSMNKFVEANCKGVKAKGMVVVGYAAEEIVALAERETADLIVMGTHGRTGIDRFLFGSVAEKVVKSARCPVMTIRPQEAAQN